MLMLFRISSAWLTKGAPADVTKLGFCSSRRLCHDRFKSPLLNSDILLSNEQLNHVGMILQFLTSSYQIFGKTTVYGIDDTDA